MRVLLAGPDCEENLSLRYLSSSLLAAGHESVLSVFNSADDTLAVAGAAQGAEIAGLSMCFQSRAQEFLRLARTLKALDPEQLIVAGGHYASCAAEALLEHHPEIDVIVLHEGERTLVEIAEALPRLDDQLPKIAGIAYREGERVRFTAVRRMLDDLDTLPFPDRRGRIHNIAGVPTSYLMGSRGCYGNCAYCCITTLHRMAPGRRFRQRRVERIAEEMAALYHERGTRQFVFHDDNFLVPAVAQNHERIAGFERALKERGVEDIALVIKCRPADANREVLRRLKDLGLVRVFLGVESATERGLSALERRQSVEDSERALDTCADLGISAQFTIMTFHPDATPETLRSDAAFLRRYSGNPLNFCRAEIYAGTPLEQRMIALGRARGNYLARVYDLEDPAADRTCKMALPLFFDRCWGNGSLMQVAIGLDHTAAVRKRFYDGQAAAVSGRVASWLRAVNLDTIGLLEEVIELGAAADGKDAGVERAIREIGEREIAARRRLLTEAWKLKGELEAVRFANERPAGPPGGSRLRLARQVAAALLAIGIPATSGVTAAAQETKTPPPASSATKEKEKLCTLKGTVSDQAGAVVANAAIVIRNMETQKIVKTKTHQNGEYSVKLRDGSYTVVAEYPGFKPASKKIELRNGEQQKLDLVLQVDNMGCCEYAAPPMEEQKEVPPVQPAPQKPKPKSPK